MSGSPSLDPLVSEVRGVGVNWGIWVIFFSDSA